MAGGQQPAAGLRRVGASGRRTRRAGKRRSVGGALSQRVRLPEPSVTRKREVTEQERPIKKYRPPTAHIGCPVQWFPNANSQATPQSGQIVAIQFGSSVSVMVQPPTDPARRYNSCQHIGRRRNFVSFDTTSRKRCQHNGRRRNFVRFDTASRKRCGDE